MSRSPIARELATFAAEVVVGEEPIVVGGADHRFERQRVDRDHATESGWPRRRPSRRRGRRSTAPSSRWRTPRSACRCPSPPCWWRRRVPACPQVELDGVRVVGVHAELLDQLAQQPGGRGRLLHGALPCGRGVGPRLVSDRYRAFPLVVQAGRQMLEHDRGTVDRGPRLRASIGSPVEVVQLPLVGQRFGAVLAPVGASAARWRTPGSVQVSGSSNVLTSFQRWSSPPSAAATRATSASTLVPT